MYLRILKRDLKRKRTMNVILLLFITLASLFVSSSVNNIISVTTALDHYFELANVPDILIATMNKSGNADVKRALREMKSVASYGTEEVLYLSNANVTKDGVKLDFMSSTIMLHSLENSTMNYFLEDNSPLKEVKSGNVYMTDASFRKSGLKIGDIIHISVDDVEMDFTLAGGIKDAVFGMDVAAMTRYIISPEDFEQFYLSDDITAKYGGVLCYLDTENEEVCMEEAEAFSENTITIMNRGKMKFIYVFDMIIAGILLVASIMLILISFVVLRFTISFTLSEEFREIGVMKAIGIGKLRIRMLYLTKYAFLAVIGAAFGLVLSYPFGKMLLKAVSKSVIMGGEKEGFVNILCAVVVVAVVVLFCFGCTAKIKRFTPVDAVRNGQTGERFRKRSTMSLGKSRLGSISFLAWNDIVSSPKRYGIVTLTFTLCLSLLLVLSATVSTLKSGTLVKTFGISESDVFFLETGNMMNFIGTDGRKNVEEYLGKLEQTLSDNGMPTECKVEILLQPKVTFGERTAKISAFYGVNTTMEQYEYTKGTAPQNESEIAITRIAAEKLGAELGDTVKIELIDGEREFLITAFFQAMNMQGDMIRFHSDTDINFVQASGVWDVQIEFTDNPDEKEIAHRIEKIKALYPKADVLLTASEFVEKNVGVADALNSVKLLVTGMTVILVALVTVLMERSFVAKETGEIALLKAVGFKNSHIYVYDTVRFVNVGVVATLFAELCLRPLLRLCIDPVFKMMGMELAVDYRIKQVEVYGIFPAVVLAATVAAAFLTALYTRKIKPSDTANIE